MNLSPSRKPGLDHGSDRASVATRRLVLAVSSVALVMSSIVASSPAEAAVIRDFTPRFTLNAAGAITLTGNTLLTCPASAAQCLQARSGTASSLAANNDNNYNMTFVDIDGDPATFNSSRNTLDIPRTSAVAWAGLYWGADTSAGTGGSPAPTAAARNSVLLQTPDTGTYRTVTASVVDVSPSGSGVRYQGFADVTSLVQDARSGEYTVANLQAGRGADRYGGWALVVVYQDPDEPVRNLTVLDGYGLVQSGANNNVTFPVSGFLTPPTGQVRTRLGVVAYEGDLGLLGDSLRLGRTATDSTILTNSLNPTNNFFNSSLTGFESTNRTGDPFQANMMGFDIDTIRAHDVLDNGVSSAVINLTTSNDTYFPGAVSFSTELFAPQIDLDKTGVDANGGSLDVGDEVLYSIRATNNGEDVATDVVVSDAVPDGTTYVSGSLVVDGVAVSDASGDDVGEISGTTVVARLGAGASTTTGGSMAIGASTTLSFRVRVGEADPDEAIVNVATATYRGATSRLPVEAISNRVVLTPRSRSDLSTQKFGPTAPVTVPGPAAFRIVVTNRGPAAELNATIIDDLPAGYTVADVTTSHGSCTTGTDVNCALGALAVGESAVVDVTGSFTSGSGVATNTATAAGDNLDLFPSNDTANAVVVLNRPPTAQNQAATTPGGTTVDVAVQTGASDPDGDALFTSAAGPATNGSVIVNPDGTVTYTPDAGFKGTDTFEFIVSDRQGGTATASVTVTVENAPPEATDDAVATPFGVAVDIAVLANDSDPNPADTIVVDSFVPPTDGTVTDIGGGTLQFDPGTFRGTTAFDYTIIDDDGATDTATVTVSVPNGAPVAVADAVTTESDVTVAIDVLGNDLDDNGQVLTVASITQPADTAAGTAILAGGAVSFDPSPTTDPTAPAFKGDVTFTYTIQDTTTPTPGTDTADVVVTVLNAAPVATNDSTTTDPGTAVTIDALSNDSDVNADALSIIGADTPTAGAVSVDGADLIYTPDSGFVGTDTFTYTISDGTDTSTASIDVSVANAPPIAAADQRQTESDTPVTVPVLANDTDPNGDALTLVPGGTSTPADGSVVENDDDTVTYLPRTGFVGVDTFTYTLTDGRDTATATVTITVIDRGPTAVDDSATTPRETTVTVDVMANDTDPEDDPLTVIAVGTPSNGTVVIDAAGAVTYTPATGFEGTDTFPYTISDGTIDSTATVTVSVIGDDPDDATTDDPEDATTDDPVVDPGDPAGTGTSTTGSPTDDPRTTTTVGSPPAGVPTDPRQQTPQIPVTGRSSVTVAFVASVMLAAGGALVLASRRRGVIGATCESGPSTCPWGPPQADS